MELVELRSQIHEKVEKAEPEVLELLIEILESATERKSNYSNADIEEFDRRVAEFNEGEVKPYTLEEFKNAIRNKTAR